MGRVLSLMVAVVLVSSGVTLGLAQPQTPASGSDPLHRPFDQILDLNVRDGYVYYRALQSSRGALDRYIASLNVPQATYDGWSKEAKTAFWINAYNAVVLQAVINRYPVRGTSPAFPPASIRQIPGAFESKHRLAGRSVSLDDIDKKILPEFNEPRALLALGRGAVGSGRLRSEAYTAARLETQLDAIRAEFVTEEQMLKVDRAAGQISTTSIVSWHEASFVAAYDHEPKGVFASRSPIERALLTFIMPNLLPLEREFAEQNQFKVVFHRFDWSLNDLTGGRAQ